MGQGETGTHKARQRVSHGRRGFDESESPNRRRLSRNPFLPFSIGPDITQNLDLQGYCANTSTDEKSNLPSAFFSLIFLFPLSKKSAALKELWEGLVGREQSSVPKPSELPT